MEQPAKRTPFSRSFWVINLMELFERMAYYGMFNYLSIYLTKSVAQGGLGFSQEERGLMQGVVTFILYLLPILAGALADRFGYRKTLLLSFTIMTPAYWLMGVVNSYALFFIVFLALAVGAASFKPIPVGTISRVTDDSNSSLGFGIFYQIVNIGGMVGPILAASLYKISWNYLFIMAAICIAINYLPALFLYREPTGQRENKSLTVVAKETALILKNWRFVLFVFLFSGFWTVWMQLFFTMPLYIEQYVDTSNLILGCKAFIFALGLDNLWPTIAGAINNKGQFDAGLLITLDALLIIIFVVPVAKIVQRFSHISVIVSGIAIMALGPLFLVFSCSSLAVVMSITVLAFGEMVASPKYLEYVGKIAPTEQKALFQGYGFLAVALGNFFAGTLSGLLYGRFADGQLSQPRPEIMWAIFAGIGLLTAALLFIYNLTLAAKK